MIEVGKCYQVTSFIGCTYIFKVKEIKNISQYDWIRCTNILYYKIIVEKGFRIAMYIERINNEIMFEQFMPFKEVEENDIDKLEHYYSLMEQSFNAIINKYK